MEVIDKEIEEMIEINAVKALNELYRFFDEKKEILL